MTKRYFSPLPNRAVADDRLGRVDYRVLGVIAAHDRFGQNGLGCVISTRQIAEILRCQQPKVSNACRKLIDLGYVLEEPNPDHVQKRMLSVIYDATDRDAFKVRTDTSEGIGETQNRYPGGHHIKETPLKEVEEIPFKTERRNYARSGPRGRRLPASDSDDFTIQDDVTEQLHGRFK